MDTAFFNRSDQRRMAYAEFGDPQGYPIIFAHGAPGSHLEGTIFDADAKQLGFRFIVLDRPGMGNSDFNPSQTMLDYPQDVKALAEHLKLERFGVMGWSGGGAPTLTCGYVIPELIDFCIVLAGYTQIDQPELVATLPQTDQFAYHLLKRPWQFNAMFWMMDWMIKLTPSMYFNMLKKTVSTADLAILAKPEYKESFMQDQKACFAAGYRGTARDARITYELWNYDLRNIKARIDIFHGTDDKLVPFAFSERTKSLVKNCFLHPLENQGHLFPFTHQQIILRQAKSCLAATK